MSSSSNPTSIETSRLSEGAASTIAVLLGAAFVVILNETILNVALTHLMEDFHVSANTVQWVATAFMLTMAVVIPTTGLLLQRFSIRSVFGAAMGSFLLGTALAAAAPSFPVLVLGRVVQGFGTAIMMPLLITTILRLVPPQRRGVIMGNVSIVISVAPALGPTISGLILSVAPWRFLFIVVLPIALAALLIGLSKLPRAVENEPGTLDLLSVLLTVPGFGFLVYGLSSFGNTENQNVVLSVSALSIGLVCVTIFIVRQLKLQTTGTPLLDLRTFTYRDYALSLLLLVLSMMALFGVVIVLPIYMLSIRELDPIQVGLILLPGGLVMGLLGPVVGRLFDRVGARPLTIVGASLLVLALGSLTFLDVHTATWYLVAAHIVLSIGLALIFTPVFTASMNPLPPHLYSHGSATLSTLQQVAAATGTALLIAVLQLTASAAAGAGGALVTGIDLMPGVKAAFYVAGGLSVVALALTFFMPGKTAEQTAGNQTPAP
ncbi:MDR family MFS transporter [Micrococcoides hystricis]|uniref:MDR family MFS transporter n=1 Tax=Micrococcoides hystricis TaxID=1572761 RepID=A0ABV6P9A3_9MICC